MCYQSFQFVVNSTQRLAVYQRKDAETAKELIS
jgi:hypothetical protein